MFEESMMYRTNQTKFNQRTLGVAGPWLIGGLLLAMMSTPAMALTSDSKEPMLIESDDMIFDEAKGETVYNGNVKAHQGSLEAIGTKMILNQQKGQADQVIIYGKPARIKQTPDGGGADNHGEGERIDYFPDSGILILNGKAITYEGHSPETSEHTVRSEHIEVLQSIEGRHVGHQAHMAAVVGQAFEQNFAW